MLDFLHYMVLNANNNDVIKDIYGFLQCCFFYGLAGNHEKPLLLQLINQTTDCESGRCLVCTPALAANPSEWLKDRWVDGYNTFPLTSL